MASDLTCAGVDQIVHAVERVEQALQVGPVDLIELAEAFGCSVRFKDFPYRRLVGRIEPTTDGFSLAVRFDAYLPRQRFTLARMIAHVVMHGGQIRQGVSLLAVEGPEVFSLGFGHDVDLEGNRCAVEWLAPIGLLHETWARYAPSLRAVADTLMVSEEFVYQRLGMLGFS